MTHTPGNWTAAKDSRACQGQPDRTDWLIWQTDADGKLAHTEPIAQVFDYLHPAEGNARLIALAPKLLKALLACWQYERHPWPQEFRETVRGILDAAQGQ